MNVTLLFSREHYIAAADAYMRGIEQRIEAGLRPARWQKLGRAGAQPQRLLWASTGTKDPEVSDTLYIKALAAPDTINTMPEETLLAFADHGKVNDVLPVDGGDAEEILARFTKVGVDNAALAAQLQREGAQSFDKSWNELMDCIASKSDMLKKANQAGGRRR